VDIASVMEVFLEREQDIAAFAMMASRESNNYLSCFKSRRQFAQVGAMRADGVDVRTGFEPFRFEDWLFVRWSR
jgi:hypothetical protein